MNNDLLGKLGILGVTVVLALQANACANEPADDTGDGDTTGDGDPGDGDGDPGDGDGDPGDGDGDPGDGDGDPGDGDGDPGDGDGDPADCPTHEPGPGSEDGSTCTSNTQCASKLCEVFQDVPPVDGSCQPAPSDCLTRIMGRTLDFVTRTEVAGVDLRVVPAIQASVDPVGAAGVAVATSDDSGTVDTLSDAPILAPLGIVGLTEANGYYLTATGLAAPADGNSYGPANDIQDIWAVPDATATEWSTYLGQDDTLTDHLPLGTAGGVVGFVRDRTTGDPVSGAVVVPTDPDTSGAIIRYLNETVDGFEADTATSSSGVFVILDPGLGETFDVELGGVSQGLSGTAGSANGAIFTLIMDVAP